MKRFDAVMYAPPARARALVLLRRHPNPRALNLRYGITFHFGWRFEGRVLCGAVTADPPRCAEARPEHFRWTPYAPDLWVGERKE